MKSPKIRNSRKFKHAEIGRSTLFWIRTQSSAALLSDEIQVDPPADGDGSRSGKPCYSHQWQDSNKARANSCKTIVPRGIDARRRPRREQFHPEGGGGRLDPGQIRQIAISPGLIFTVSINLMSNASPDKNGPSSCFFLVAAQEDPASVIDGVLFCSKNDPTQRKRDSDPKLVSCWAIVCDDGQHETNIGSIVSAAGSYVTSFRAGTSQRGRR